MRQVAIRPVTPDDRDAWLRMRQALWPDVDAEDHAREVAVQLDQDPDEGAVFVAGHGGDAVGFLEVSRTPEAPGCDTCPVGLVEAWFVEPDVRRLGIGRALVEAARAWTRSQGMVEMASDARADNRVSRRAHRAVGFEETDEAVHFRLVA